MKKLSLAAFVIFVTNFVTAQEIAPKDSLNGMTALRNEAGINFFSLLGRDSRVGGMHPIDAIVFNGVTYKRHFNRNAARAGFELYRLNFHDEVNSEGDQFSIEIKGKLSSAEFRIGFERTFFTGKISFYGALDALALYQISKGESVIWGGIAGDSYENYDEKKTFTGFAPAAGLCYKPIAHFSVTAESNLTFLFLARSNSLRTPDKKTFLINPLKLLTFSYHFGK